jgi:hypothetical protein
MKEEKIQEVLKDPNTWCWDGVTLPEEDHYSAEFNNKMDEYVKKLKEMQKNANSNP